MRVTPHAALSAVLALALAAASGLAPRTAQAAQPGACDDWSAYRQFVARFVQPDGRVVDFSTPTQQTTSEGQSYGMFFALVANDRATFDKLLGWTRANLSAGRFDAGDVKLPAWQWGRKPDGSYGVLDPNSASDSDLWIAYDLFQAGRLWHEPSYTKLAWALATQIEKQEVVTLAGLGPMLLPGPQGFQSGGTTRLNPSYLPLPVLRALAAEAPSGPWSSIAANAYTLIKTTAPLGFAPDWAAWRDGRFIVDPKSGDVGSYDAIRVYLWAGLAAPADPLAKPWLAALGGMRERIAQTGIPPERVAYYHLAGHTNKGTHIIDTHSDHAIEAVWKLYERACELSGGRSTLYEWDENIPAFGVVHAEALKAKKRLEKVLGKKRRDVAPVG